MTNSQWGDGIAPTRFLSCRQSAPARDKLDAVGDSKLSIVTRNELKQISHSLGQERDKTRNACDLIKALQANKFLSTIQSSEKGPFIQVELVPGLNPARNGYGVSTCTIFIRDDPVFTRFHPVLENFVKRRYRLSILIDSELEDADMTCDIPEQPPSVIEQLTLAQTVALDYLILDRLHHEIESGVNISKWTITSRNRFTTDLGVSAVRVTAGKITRVNICLRPMNSLQSTTAQERILNPLRESFIDWSTTTHAQSELLSTFFRLVDIGRV